MADSITMNDDWEFHFEEPKQPLKVNKDPNMSTNYLEGEGKWENYSDQKLYEIESLLRAFLQDKKENDYKWMHHSKWRKYTLTMMFEVLYGRKWDQKEDGAGILYKLSKIMGHYSTRILKSGTTIRGKMYKKKVFILSANRLDTPPYSLRLRLEWLADRGELPCWQNMRLPKDLEPGHARNPKVEAKMQERSKKGYAVWREQQNGANRVRKSERKEKWIWDAYQGKRVPESELSDAARQARQEALREAEH